MVEQQGGGLEHQQRLPNSGAILSLGGHAHASALAQHHSVQRLATSQPAWRMRTETTTRLAVPLYPVMRHSPSRRSSFPLLKT